MFTYRVPHFAAVQDAVQVGPVLHLLAVDRRHDVPENEAPKLVAGGGEDALGRDEGYTIWEDNEINVIRCGKLGFKTEEADTIFVDGKIKIKIKIIIYDFVCHSVQGTCPTKVRLEQCIQHTRSGTLRRAVHHHRDLKLVLVCCLALDSPLSLQALKGGRLTPARLTRPAAPPPARGQTRCRGPDG